MTREQFLKECDVNEILVSRTEEEHLETVKQNGYNLQHVKKQTEAICLEAVKENGYSLPYVKKQTEAICLEAVKEDAYSLQYVTLDFNNDASSNSMEPYESMKPFNDSY